MSYKKSPLRYPGGKSRAIKFLKDYFPKDFMEYREPFFGGGSFIGRKILSNECGYLEINRDTIHIFMQIFRIFGLLSRTHKHDCLAILEYLLKKYNK